jgi:acetyltransferase
MSVRNLDKIFKPGRVAVIGASDTPTSVGYNVLHNMIGSGFRGVVYPVNPKREAVQGVPAFPDLAGLPKAPDLAVICTPSPSVPDLIRQCGELGIYGVVIISAGFREIGPEGLALEAQVRAEQARFDGMRIIGPNCLGLIVPRLKVNLSFANAAMPKAGHVAFISQSGALCTSVLDWALTQGIGFSYFVSVGNMLDVTFSDLIDYFGQDEDTRSMMVYIESIPEARQFMSAARAFARSKPVVAYKSGRFAESAKAAASHTGALAGEDAVYDAAFERAGIERVFEIDDMFECAELLGRVKQIPRGDRLAIVTNAGGPGVMATDKLIAAKGTLAELSEPTLEKLNAALPPFWSHNNPVDVLGDAPPDRYMEATRVVLEDANVDAVLVVLTPQAMTDPTQIARVIGKLAQTARKPILAAWMGGNAVSEGVRLLNEAGIPTYDTPGQAVRAFMHLVSYARNLEILYETPRELPMTFQLGRRKAQDLVAALEGGESVLNEATSKALLEDYGIPIIRPYDAASADDAIAVARRIGYPVVLKVLSPQITHKTDVGGVVLNLQTDDEVRAAFERIVAAARAKRPDADVQGVTVQKMVDTRNGVELIIGAKKDPTFGSIIMVGMGGVYAELFKDRALGLPPLNERLARRMLEALKSWPLLNGYRGRPVVNLDRLIEVLMRFSYLVADHSEVTELDINPILVTPQDVIALDARVAVDRDLARLPATHKLGGRYAHLAIRPYPEEYSGAGTLRDGTPVTLRPIRPEDEPLWLDLLSRCSMETIRYRFRYLFKEATHEFASRHCFIDYDREMAIMAFVEQDGRPVMIGGGRLALDPVGEAAEYATMMADAWQGKGAGTLLLDYCMDVARRMGLKKVRAETTLDNNRMLAVFHKRGFTREQVDGNEIVLSRPL